MHSVRVADGSEVVPLGVCDVPVTVQLMLQLEDGAFVHWDRSFCLKGVWVLPLGVNSPRDLYVSWADWRFAPGADAPSSPLGSLAHMVFSGAVVVDSPRVPPPDAEPLRVMVQ